MGLSNPVGIDAIAVDGLIGEWWRCTIVTFGPGTELPHPLLGIGFLKVSD